MKNKSPLRSRFFWWYLYRGVVLTKDNLAKCVSGKVAKHDYKDLKPLVLLGAATPVG
jgi:hypothetical protein